MHSSITADQENLVALALSRLPPRINSVAVRRALELGSFEALQTTLTSTEMLDRHMGAARKILESAALVGCRVIAATAPGYPDALRDIPMPPPVLFVRGDCTDSAFALARMISIVGSRNATVDQCSSVAQLARDLSELGITVVSGLAIGIDGAAHRGAVAGARSCAGGHISTVAVLAHGLDQLYPSSHASTADEILDSGGLLVSTYAPGEGIMKHRFLERNAIIAALSKATIVAAARHRSGALVTANQALDLGRDVFVFDSGDPADVGEGCSGLVDEGAQVVEGAGDVMTLTGLGGPGVDHGVSGCSS